MTRVLIHQDNADRLGVSRFCALNGYVIGTTATTKFMALPRTRVVVEHPNESIRDTANGCWAGVRSAYVLARIEEWRAANPA